MSKTYTTVLSINDIAAFLQENFLDDTFNEMRISCTVYLNTALAVGNYAQRVHLSDKFIAFDFHDVTHQTVIDFITTYFATTFTRLVVYYKGNESHLKISTQQDAFSFSTSNSADITALSTPSDAVITLTSIQTPETYYEITEDASGNYVYDFSTNFAQALVFAVTNFADLVQCDFDYTQKSPLFAWNITENVTVTKV